MADTQSMVMMAVGPYRFSLSTAAYQQLERESSWRWASVDLLGARPQQQYIGPNADTVRMSGAIYPHFRGGLGQVDQMRAAAGGGEPLTVVDGTGRNWGRWAIRSVRETQATFFSNGTPRRIDFEIELIQCEDRPLAAVRSGTRN